ncbi:MAG: hypothetical protein DRJ10_05050 [Bacteroidetes bacterium]|nr:MAG: hypothetical protein DRJ10_05050 [Bacteroidota bacterium]
MLEKKLQKNYFLIVTPAILLILIFFILEKLGFTFVFQTSGKLVSTLIIILAASTSTILPIWYKLILIKRLKNKKKVSFEEFLTLQNKTIFTAAFSIYWIFPAYMYQIPNIPMLLISFFAIYALYYYYPSKRRIDMEKKTFRINHH